MGGIVYERDELVHLVQGTISGIKIGEG